MSYGRIVAPSEVVKGYFTFTLVGNVLTVAATGVTKVRFPKQGTYGAHVTLDLTGKSYTINDAGHGTPQFLGLLGSVASVAWAKDYPVRVYLVNKDNTAANVEMALTHNHQASAVTPTANYIGKSGTAPTSNNVNNWIICDSGATTADFVSLPVVRIGGVLARKDNSAGGSWTFQAMSAYDGYGATYQGFPFGVPGQYGAGNAYHYYGTTPFTFATPASCHYVYTMSDAGIHVQYTTAAGGDCTNGTGANLVSFQFHHPIAYATASGTWVPMGCAVGFGGNGTIHGYINSTAAASVGLYKQSLVGINSNSVAAVTDDLCIDYSYPSVWA